MYNNDAPPIGVHLRAVLILLVIFTISYTIGYLGASYLAKIAELDTSVLLYGSMLATGKVIIAVTVAFSMLIAPLAGVFGVILTLGLLLRLVTL